MISYSSENQEQYDSSSQHKKLTQNTQKTRQAEDSHCGGVRLLGIPAVRDRLIQQAIAQVLTEICAPDFSERGSGFRPGRFAHDAIYTAREYIGQPYTIAVDMDREKFFDTVNHDVLMCRASRKIHDKRVLRLIGKFLRAGVEGMSANKAHEAYTENHAGRRGYRESLKSDHRSQPHCGEEQLRRRDCLTRKRA